MIELVYVAGPLTTGAVGTAGFNGWEYERNVRKAEDIALRLLSLGFAPHCPHTQSRAYFGALSENVFIRAGLLALRRCDALVLVGGVTALRSAGTRGEVLAAISIGLPVFLTVENLCKGISHPNDALCAAIANHELRTITGET